MDKIQQVPSLGLTQQTSKQEGWVLEEPSKHDDVPLPENHRLHRGFKARHITMIAIGGAIGNGLIIGTGAALGK